MTITYDLKFPLKLDSYRLNVQYFTKNLYELLVIYGTLYDDLYEYDLYEK